VRDGLLTVFGGFDTVDGEIGFFPEALLGPERFVRRCGGTRKSKDKNSAGLCGLPHLKIEMGGTRLL